MFTTECSSERILQISQCMMWSWINEIQWLTFKWTTRCIYILARDVCVFQVLCFIEGVKLSNVNWTCLCMLIKVPVWYNLVLLIYPSYGPWKSLNLILTNGQEPCEGATTTCVASYHAGLSALLNFLLSLLRHCVCVRHIWLNLCINTLFYEILSNLLFKCHHFCIIFEKLLYSLIIYVY